MAIDSGYYEGANDNMTTDEIAALLVELFADYKCSRGDWSDDKSEKYARAVGIAIRMLND